MIILVVLAIVVLVLSGRGAHHGSPGAVLFAVLTAVIVLSGALWLAALVQAHLGLIIGVGTVVVAIASASRRSHGAHRRSTAKEHLAIKERVGGDR